MKLIISESEIKTAIVEWVHSNHSITIDRNTIELQSEQGFNVYDLIAIIEEVNHA
jgi:hypothetical protein